MTELYDLAKEHGQLIYHGNYRLYNNHTVTAFDSCAVRLISIKDISDSTDTDVTVLFSNGESSHWSTKWISSYTYQFGVAVSWDGKYVFAQVWDNGLICLDSRTGTCVWKTKSKRGITNIFVNKATVLCHQHEQALELLDIDTGQVLKEKRPATAWGFTAIDHKHIVCQVTGKRWEIIDAETLETKAHFTHRSFTDGHESYCVNDIRRNGSMLIIRGFKNVWDESAATPQRLPNLEFENRIYLDKILTKEK